MQVMTPNSVAASEAMPRKTFTSRPATRKCSTLPTYWRTMMPATIVATRYSPTMLPSIAQEKCVVMFSTQVSASTGTRKALSQTAAAAPIIAALLPSVPRSIRTDRPPS